MERPQAPDTLSMEDFSRLDIRVGTVLRAEAHHETDPPAYRLWIDFGGLGVRQASAQITRLYRPEDLVGRQLAAVVNIQPRRVAGLRLDALVLGAATQNGSITLLAPEAYAPDGQRIR